MISRRCFTNWTGFTLIALEFGSREQSQAAPAGREEFGRSLEKLEERSGGRLGVSVLDAASSIRMGRREDERFPLCSTFKVLAAGAILTQVDAGHAQLTQKVRFAANEVVAYSPITQGRIGGEGMTLAELCAAAIEYSDNTAGNMLLKQIGGPAGLTQFARSIGDPATRLDRTETELNGSVPGDPRDTTTPAAMVSNLNDLVFGSALSALSREKLVSWLKDNTTGGTRLRAGLPAGWVVGDKTGAGDHGSTNDVAVIWPLGRKPLLIAAYLTATDAPVEERNATLAAVGRAAALAFSS